MEFGEKLQSLRKQRGLTQEELSEALYVSRTAVSKWESCKGYPGIDSLKAISEFFSVSIDELLSSEKVLTIAEKENKQSIKNICNYIFAFLDVLFISLIFLPLYPYKAESYIYSVNLLNYSQISSLKITVYWVLFLLLILLGIIKCALIKASKEKYSKVLTCISMAINILLVLFLALSREVYATVSAFLFLIIKGIVLIKYVKTGN